MAQASFRVADEVVASINDRLVTGQAKSTWYRHACETMVLADQSLDRTHDLHDYEARQNFVLAAVREKIERDREADKPASAEA